MKISTSIFVLLIGCISVQQVSAQSDFTGIWELSDEDGETFLINISEDRTVATTYVKGDHRIVPKEGFWRMNGDDLHIMYNNGWMDVVRKEKTGFTSTTYAPGADIGRKADKSTPAFKTGRKSLWGAISENDFVGYWKLLDEHQKPFYLHVSADHSARSTYNDGRQGVFGEKGTWRFEQNRIMVVYDSGWIDVIVKNDTGLVKYAFAPGQRISGKPDNTSVVRRAAPEETKVKQ